MVEGSVWLGHRHVARPLGWLWAGSRPGTVSVPTPGGLCLLVRASVAAEISVLLNILAFLICPWYKTSSASPETLELKGLQVLGFGECH